jgi:hypothetical protein
MFGKRLQTRSSNLRKSASAILMYCASALERHSPTAARAGHVKAATGGCGAGNAVETASRAQNRRPRLFYVLIDALGFVFGLILGLNLLLLLRRLPFAR